MNRKIGDTWISEEPIGGIEILGTTASLQFDHLNIFQLSIIPNQPKKCLEYSDSCIGLPLNFYGYSSFGFESSNEIEIFVLQDKSKKKIY